MALSEECIDKHIKHWEQSLSNSRYPWTSKWPSRIFRHDPIENIVQILESGSLLSRDDSNEIRTRDIAARDVINSTDEPHQFVRLYFRPRTPTQYHVEGIRKTTECYQTDTSCLIGLMIFQSRNLLSRSDVKFSDMNMQSSAVSVGFSEEFFNTNIDFSSVYHHGWQGSSESIRKARCAEVLLESPLSIHDCLQHIYCRTNAERDTLLHLLSRETSERWRDKILVSDDMKLFERKYCFVDDVYITRTGVIANLSPRDDNNNISIDISILNIETGQNVYSYRNVDFHPRPQSGKKGWIFKFDVTPNNHYHVCINMENCIAYDNILSFRDLPF